MSPLQGSQEVAGISSVIIMSSLRD